MYLPLSLSQVVSHSIICLNLPCGVFISRYLDFACHLVKSYYIPNLRNYLKKVSCNLSKGLCQTSLSQHMRLLPACRTTPAPPIQVVELDFAGPFQIKQDCTIVHVCLAAFLCQKVNSSQGRI